jgi:hypothetical protein
MLIPDLHHKNAQPVDLFQNQIEMVQLFNVKNVNIH